MGSNTPNIELDQYDSWNELKKNIQTMDSGLLYFPQVGEVWMSNVGKNLGFEQNGSGASFSRPILVLKKFNSFMFWCVPLSTKQKSLDFYHNFVDPSGQSVSAILAQLKVTSIKRFQRKLYTMPPETFIEIKNKILSLIV